MRKEILRTISLSATSPNRLKDLPIRSNYLSTMPKESEVPTVAVIVPFNIIPISSYTLILSSQLPLTLVSINLILRRPHNLPPYYIFQMDDPDSKVRQQLSTASDLFSAGKYAQCKKYPSKETGSWGRSNTPTPASTSTSPSQIIKNHPPKHPHSQIDYVALPPCSQRAQRKKALRSSCTHHS